MAKESNQDVQSTSARVAKDTSKKVAKAEVNLNWSLWIDYNNWLWIVLILYLYRFYCSTYSKSTKSMKPNTSVQNGQKFFILFGKKYYFIQKLKFSYKLKLYYFIQKLKFSYNKL